MQTILIVIHLFVAIALTIVVLLQRSEGGALGMGGSGGGGLGGIFSPRGAANTLTRTTAILGILFFLTSLALTWLTLHNRPTGSLLDQPGQAGTSAPASPAPPSRIPNIQITPAPAGTAPTPGAPATAPAATTTPAPAPQPPAVPPSH